MHVVTMRAFVYLNILLLYSHAGHASWGGGPFSQLNLDNVRIFNKLSILVSFVFNF